METWKKFDENIVSHSAAHYLLAIRDLNAQWGYARVSDIAEKLAITKGSASQSIKALRARGWVTEDDHRMLHLSETGESLAASIAVQAEVLERFFHHVLGLSEEQARVDACKVEHLMSPEVIDRLRSIDQYLESNPSLNQKLQKAISGK